MWVTTIYYYVKKIFIWRTLVLSGQTIQQGGNESAHILITLFIFDARFNV